MNSMNSIEVCAGIVTYNPDIKRLQENIAAIVYQVSKVFIVDNCSENVESIEKVIGKYATIVLIKNDQNEGIAKALNQIMLKAKRYGYNWMLTLDQDSVCYSNLVNNYFKYIDVGIGMLICDIIDRNYELKFTSPKYFLEDVDKCITSGCLSNIDAIFNTGGFDESLFMDMVDYDMCYSLREQGYRIVRAHFIGLLHEVGKSKKYNILGFEFVVNNHPADRKYTITRNSVYLIKKHKLNPITEYILIFRRIFTVLFFESNKFEKVKAIFKGVVDGWEMQKNL